MKKVAIFSIGLTSNGATKSLVELLKRIDLARCCVDLWVLSKDNFAPYVEEIPSKIKIEVVPVYTAKSIIRDCLLHPIHFVKAICAGWKLRQNVSAVEYMKYTAMRHPVFNQKYDIAISYRHFDVDVFYVSNNIKAKEKYFYCHGVQPLNNEEIYCLKNAYKYYSKIFPVSQAALNNLVSFFPELEERCKCCYSVIDGLELFDKAKLGTRFSKKNNETVIFTCARLSSEKGIDLALRACRLLVKKQYYITWYVAGDGPMQSYLETEIEKNNLQKSFILLGNCENPYGYFSCDIYVQPSLQESYCLAVNEAQIFNKPVVATKIPAHIEQIDDHKNGRISDLDETSMAKSIEDLILDSKQQQSIINQLEQEQHSHYEAVDFFNNVILGSKNTGGVLPLVSIIVPCYNGERFIVRCIGSILTQTYKNIEIIFVDDGSTDHTSEIIKKYPQVSYIYQENVGLGGAVKKGISHIKGEYLALLDIDDLLLPNSIEKRVKFLETHPDYDVVQTNGYYTTEDSINKPTRLWVDKTEEKERVFIFEDLVTGRINNWSCGHMTRTKPLLDFYQKHDFYPSRNGQNLQILMPLAYKGKRGFIDEALALYIYQENSLSQVVDKEIAFERIRKNYLGYTDIRLHMLKDIVEDVDELARYTNMVETESAKNLFWHCYEYKKRNYMRQYLVRLKKVAPAIFREARTAYYQSGIGIIDKILFLSSYLLWKLSQKRNMI